MTRLAVFAVLALTCGCATTSKPKSPELEVSSAFMNDARGSKTMPAWFLYGMSRRLYIDMKYPERAPKGSPYRYTFEEELEARGALAGVWAEMRIKQSVSDPYLDEVSLVQSAGFMKEYVWHCVPHPAWSSPSGLRSAEFATWLSEKLPQHRVETWVKTQPSPEGMRVLIGVSAHAPAACTALSTGGELPVGAGTESRERTLERQGS